MILKPLFPESYLTGKFHSCVMFLISFSFLSIIYDAEEEKGAGGEGRRSFVGVPDYLFNSITAHTNIYFFFSRDIIQHLNLFKAVEIKMLIYLLDMVGIPSVSLSLSLWINHTLKASFMISSLCFFKMEQNKCRNCLDIFLIFVVFSVFMIFSSIFNLPTFFLGDLPLFTKCFHLSFH